MVSAQPRGSHRQLGGPSRLPTGAHGAPSGGEDGGQRRPFTPVVRPLKRLGQLPQSFQARPLLDLIVLRGTAKPGAAPARLPELYSQGSVACQAAFGLKVSAPSFTTAM